MYNHHPLEERLEAIRLIKKGMSFNAVSIRLHVEKHQVIQWSKAFELNGIEGLKHPYFCRKNIENDIFSCDSAKKSIILSPQKRKTSLMGHPRKKVPQTDLEKLQEENEYLRTELALLKKARALMAEKEARLLEIGRKSSSH